MSHHPLATDPDFYLKWIGVRQSSAIKDLQVTSIGDKLYVWHKAKLLAEIPAAVFYRSSVNELLSIIGVPKDDSII